MQKNTKGLIASIGSDRDRDFQTLASAARQLSNFSFEIHTSRKSIQNISMSPNIKIVTNATPLQSRDLLQKAEIVIIPLHETSRAAGQLALVDALLMRKPVIVSKTRGIVEAYGLQNKKSAFLVPPEDSHTLIHAIQTLSSDSGLQRKISTGGFRIAIRYTTQRYAEKIQQVINRVPTKSFSAAD